MNPRPPTGRPPRERRRLLILGSDRSSKALARGLLRRTESRVRIVAHIRLEGEEPDSGLDAPVHEISELAQLLGGRGIDEVVTRGVPSEEAVALCTAEGIPLTISSELPGEDSTAASVGDGGTQRGSRTPLWVSARLQMKRGLDVGLAATGLLLAAPVLGIAALAIQISSPGPLLSRQIRCGLHGRRFPLLRLRTGAKGGVGGLVHACGIDDLPLLWNVLRGDMSLVGPRPPLPVELARSGSDAARRLSMRPGLTCLWQLHDLPAPCPDECAKLDLQYVDGWSLRTDFKILALTLPAVLRSSDT